MATNYKDFLIPGRACGACTACCVHLAIVEEELQKPASIACGHCTADAGCGIYETRPRVCRGFHCAWRSMPALDEGWRPDRSGVMMQWGTPPAGSPGAYALDLLLIGGPEVLATDRFASMASGFVAQGVATFLNIPRGAAGLAVQCPLNELLAPAIAARSRAQAKGLLRAAYDHMIARPIVPVGEEHLRPRAASATPG